MPYTSPSGSSAARASAAQRDRNPSPLTTVTFLASSLLGARLAAAQPAVLVAEVASATTFRLGVRFGGWAPAALASPGVDNRGATAPSTPVAWGGMTGVQTSFGALLTDGAARWALYDAANNTLVASGAAPPSLNNGSGNLDAGIVLPVSGAAAASGPARQCLGNGYFGPTFYYNREAASFAFAVSSWSYDPAQHHCYPVSFSGSVGGGSSDMCDNTKSETDVTNSVRSDKYPNGLNGTTLASCCAACKSDPTCIAYVWSDGTVPDPNGNCWPFKSFDAEQDRPGRIFGGAPPAPPVEAWWAMGQAADWYLAPAASPLDFTRIFYELTGAPAVPPRHGVAFMATYWGYTTMEEVEGYMTKFRDGAFPIDSFIMDYDVRSTEEPAPCSFHQMRS